MVDSVGTDPGKTWVHWRKYTWGNKGKPGLLWEEWRRLVSEISWYPQPPFSVIWVSELSELTQIGGELSELTQISELPFRTSWIFSPKMGLNKTVAQFFTLYSVQMNFCLPEFSFDYVKVFFEHLAQLGGHLSLYYFVDCR